MRQVRKDTNNTIICNMCSKNIQSYNGIFMEDVFEGYKEWGYFSNKDLEIHKFTLCEECYEKLVGSFKIPVQVSEIIEVMYPGKQTKIDMVETS